MFDLSVMTITLKCLQFMYTKHIEIWSSIPDSLQVPQLCLQMVV